MQTAVQEDAQEGFLVRSLNNMKGDVFVRWDAESANLSHMGLRSVPRELAACPRLKFLNLSKNALDSLDSLPPSLYRLNVSFNRLRSLEGLPDALQELYAWSNALRGELDGTCLPHGLQKLYAVNNRQPLSKIEGKHRGTLPPEHQEERTPHRPRLSLLLPPRAAQVVICTITI